MADILNQLLGIADGSPLAELRAQRPEATTHMEGSYRALFVNESKTTVTRSERFAVALRVASLHAEPVLVERYAAGVGSPELAASVRAGPAASGLSPRLKAMLTHADLLVIRPAAATSDDLLRLKANGLSDPEVVTVSQVIAFLSFQLRVFAALALLRGDDRKAPGRQIGPRDPVTEGFTRDELSWAPWIEPPTVEQTTDEQKAVLPGRRLESPYFRLLSLDPPVLGERTATDMGIFYTHGGLPRAERELSATAASRVNGCVYCASVHSRQAATISKRVDDVQRLLDVGIGAKLDDRWRALVDLAAALTTTPTSATQTHVQKLRDLGLNDLELLDAMQSAAFFNWANRLMLTLGEPVRP